MLKRILFAVAALSLAGCGVPEFFDRTFSPSGSPPANDRPAVAVSGASTGAPAIPPGIATYCTSLAKSRAEDAAINGYDDDTQRAVHDGTYKDCVAWQTTHM